MDYPAGYDVLHDAMELRGFKKQRTADDGTVWQLLPGTYDIDGDYTDSQVRLMALAAANSLGFRAAVQVDRVVSRMWSGLREVTPSRSPFDGLRYGYGYGAYRRPNPSVSALADALGIGYGSSLSPPSPALLGSLAAACRHQTQ
ncbi:MAG: hypothetical protein JNK76_08525 [Planctomycetales bacterium]|nr:hypothetical protein [Planctomycetales bacterium]